MALLSDCAVTNDPSFVTHLERIFGRKWGCRPSCGVVANGCYMVATSWDLAANGAGVPGLDAGPAVSREAVVASMLQP